MSKTLVIAEAGVNHNGCFDTAIKLITQAHKAGADIVKFQTFKAEKLVTRHAQLADYQRLNLGPAETQLSMLQRLELDYSEYKKLLAYCNDLQIEFLSTAFDSESLIFLVSELQLKRLKVPSGELTNAPFLLEHARTGCDLIISTGMATLYEVECALEVIAFGLMNHTEKPSKDAFQRAFSSREGQKKLKRKVTILHCTSQYPAPLEDINLKAIDTLKSSFNLPVGYSDHSLGVFAAIAAVARGACVIEKHFTLDKNMPGPDHKASIEPKELALLIKGVREVELALGDGFKTIKPSEIENKKVVRKSLVAGCAIVKGEMFTPHNVSIKRPGDGLSPYSYWDVLEKTATRDFKEGDFICE